MIRKAPFLAAALGLIVAGRGAAAPDLNPAAVPAGHYELDPAHASITARVLHMGLSRFTLRFDKVTASYDYDPSHPQASQVRAEIAATSLDTGSPGDSRRFADLFLDSGAHPTVTFISSRIIPTDASHGQVEGALTLAGVTRPVVLDVTYNGTEAEIVGGRRMGFSATAHIKRSDFGQTTLSAFVGDQVDLDLELEFVRRGPVAPHP